MSFIAAEVFAENCFYAIRRQKKGKRTCTMDKNERSRRKIRYKKHF